MAMQTSDPEPFRRQDPFHCKRALVPGGHLVSVHFSLAQHWPWCVFNPGVWTDEGRRPGLNDWIVLAESGSQLSILPTVEAQPVKV